MQPVPTVDVSVVLNLHNESLWMLPTFASLAATRAHAKRVGISSEVIVVLDSPDERTHTLAHAIRQKFDVGQLHLVSNQSLAQSRMDGIRHAAGTWVWTADADDLVSENALKSHVDAARESDRETAVFFEYVVPFESDASCDIYRYSDSQKISARHFFKEHPYTSRIFTRRETFEKHAYVTPRTDVGFAYEDWDLNARLYTAGFSMIVAPGSVLFYRQRPHSIMSKLGTKASVLIEHSKIFTPRFAKSESAAADSSQLTELTSDAVEKIDAECAEQTVRIAALEQVQYEPSLSPILEPAANVRRIPLDPSALAGNVFFSLIRLLPEEPFRTVVILSGAHTDEASVDVLDIVRKLDSESDQQALVLYGGASESSQNIAFHARGMHFVDIANVWPVTNLDDLYLIAARLVLAVAGNESTIHVQESPFSLELLHRYGRAMTTAGKIHYHRASSMRKHRSDFTFDTGLDAVRNHYDLFERIWYRSQALLEIDESRTGPLAERVFEPYGFRADAGVRDRGHQGPGGVLFIADERCASSGHPMLQVATELERGEDGLEVSLTASPQWMSLRTLFRFDVAFNVRNVEGVARRAVLSDFGLIVACPWCPHDVQTLLEALHVCNTLGAGQDQLVNIVPHGENFMHSVDARRMSAADLATVVRKLAAGVARTPQCFELDTDVVIRQPSANGVHDTVPDGGLEE